MSNHHETKNKNAVADVISIDREQQSFLDSLKRYETDPILDKFLDVFEKAISRPEEMAGLHKSLSEHAISRFAPNDVERLQDLIAIFSFKNAPKLEGARSLQTELDDAITSKSINIKNQEASLPSLDLKAKSGPSDVLPIEDLMPNINDIGNMSRELEELRKGLLDKSNRYFIFSPAMEIEQFLREDFDDIGDPAKKIADYVRAAFSHPSASSPDSDVGSIEADSLTIACLLLLLRIINDCSEKEPSEGNSRLGELIRGFQFAFMYLIKVPMSISKNELNSSHEEVDDNLELSTSDYWLIKILSHGYALTQKLFDCVIEHQFNSDEHRAYSPAIFYFLCQFPFAVPYASVEELRAGVNESNVSDLSDGKWNKQWHRLPVMRWSSSHHLLGEIVSIYDPEGKAALHLGYSHLMGKYSDYRKRNGGYSPLEVEHTANLWGDVQSNVSSINNDPILVIGGLYQFGFGDHDLGGLGCSWLLDESGNALPDRLARRASLYIAIAEQAFADGTEEFAAALLGFFLYSQSLFGEKGLYTDASRLSALISRSFQGPGRGLLEICLNVTVRRLDQAKAPLEVMLLSSYLRPRPALVVLPPNPKKIEPLPPDKAVLQTSLRSKYPLVFERFSEQACELLIEAELMWVRMAADYGSGIREWGALGIALTKPLEVELVMRLKNVYTSPDYKQYRERSGSKTSAKATLGAIVHMLRVHSDLPKSVAASISQAGVTLPIDKKLLLALEKVRISRNDAAHSDPFTDENYLGLRKVLFNEGGLSTLAAALKPTR